MHLARTSLAGISALSICAGCGGGPANAVNGAAVAAQAAQPDYQSAPEISEAVVDAGGHITLSGTASPGVAVRLASPGGAAQFATAEADGRWRMALTSSSAARLFGLSMSSGGPVVQAMGYIFVAPNGTAARLRAGGGTETLAPGVHGLTALALDYDKRRAAVLSGLAAPGEPVTLRVDGVERGQATADRAGRFVLSLNQPLDAGSHVLDLASPSGQSQASVSVGDPAALAKGPFSAGRQGHGWRVDWLTPGGGEQTTLVFDNGAGA